LCYNSLKSYIQNSRYKKSFLFKWLLNKRNFTKKEILNKRKSITFPTMLPSRTPSKSSKNTIGSDFVFRTRLLVFPENKIRTNTKWNFVSFFDVKGLCWPSYNPRISCNAIAGSYERSTMTMTPQTHLKAKKIEKNVRKEAKKNEGNWWRSRPFYSLKSVIGLNYNQIKCVPQPKPRKNH